ncbi:hypothetical protein, partial [Pseudomonas gingeri]|uniref:hypothetical protein n=1 Tax=Pseudomonas gingeri TaxID=117681 RepID=UPI003B97338B
MDRRWLGLPPRTRCDPRRQCPDPGGNRPGPGRAGDFPAGPADGDRQSRFPGGGGGQCRGSGRAGAHRPVQHAHYCPARRATGADRRAAGGLCQLRCATDGT